MSYTPAPLIIRDQGDYFQIEHSDGYVKSIVATLYKFSVADEYGDALANAKLFALAPIMVDTLRAIVDNIHERNQIDPEALTALRDARLILNKL